MAARARLRPELVACILADPAFILKLSVTRPAPAAGPLAELQPRNAAPASDNTMTLGTFILAYLPYSNATLDSHSV